ncbi:MAG TPA: radical SAM protein [Longimicrobium sp.]|jgi:MoaA/NifB/PqqE/SkfB family radical SAM enzyme|uniref:radical SAM protein n=1 Tax=Longimicrobium sp. TaxID=2029185 RepID=UPI002ED78D65
MLLGFALTEHCNLRCPHCIRDDVTTVVNLSPELVFRTTEAARDLFGNVVVSMTGGEPTIHPQWDAIIAGLHARGVPYRFVTNGWHMRRLMPGLDRHPPAYVRISLSGADEATHDAERGRGSFRRVMMAMALLTSRQIPAALSIVIDRRDRHQVRRAADLAESLGALRLHYILPQPVPGSAARDSDLPPEEWPAVRDEILALAADPSRRCFIQMDYGAPAEDGRDEELCQTLSGQRVYVDAKGRLSVCCQLSEYGFNERDVVADLNELPFAEAWTRYQQGLAALARASRPRNDGDPFDKFPCMRCARSQGKMEWIRQYPASPWVGAAGPAPVRPLVTLGPRRVLAGTAA